MSVTNLQNLPVIQQKTHFIANKHWDKYKLQEDSVAK